MMSNHKHSETPANAPEGSGEVAHKLANKLGSQLAARNFTITTAESCTGGLVAAAITGIAGSSAWFERGFVTYANSAKSSLVDVSAETLGAHGAVSEPVVREMVLGAAKAARADVALSVSGIAGPGGAVEGKPVGTVWIAWLWPAEHESRVDAQRFQFDGDRAAIRQQAVAAALHGTIHRLDNQSRPDRRV